MAGSAVRPPVWFMLVVTLLLLWEAVGLFACIQQFRFGAEAMGPASDYDRALYAAMPGWYDYCYALAVGTGFFGALALLLRSRVAVPLAAVSLAAVVVQFGYLFLASDIIEVKGVWTAYFPLFIIALGVFTLWLARRSTRRGWIS